MQEKTTLISSMNNLINHIIVSHKNQEEMFDSLSRKDFDKIMNNLEDPLQKLRVTTAQLLTQLLYNNQTLKKKFCELMDIHFCQSSNIILNNNINKLLQKHKIKSTQLFFFIKSDSRISTPPKKTQPLFWFINLKKDKITVEYIYRDDLNASSNSSLSTNANSSALNNVSFDPIDCIFGFTIKPSCIQQKSNTRITIAAVVAETKKAKDSLKFGQFQRAKETTYNNTQKINANQPTMFIPIKNTSTLNVGVFLKPTNKHQQPNLQHKLQIKKTDINLTNPKLDDSTPSPFIYLNSPSNLSHQTHNSTTKKKQNQQLIPCEKKDKNTTRLSLQTNNTRQKKNITLQIQTKQNGSKKIIKDGNQYQHGFKLTTPKNDLKNYQKLTANHNNGSQTQRPNIQPTNLPFHDSIQRAKIKIRANQFLQNVSNTQKLKTTNINKGSKGWETTRDNQNNSGLHN